MCQVNWQNVQELFYQKDDERNLISATFHMFSITLISMSLVDLTWFSISGDVCIPYLTMGQFFWFGYVDKGINYYCMFYCGGYCAIQLSVFLLYFSV